MTVAQFTVPPIIKSVVVRTTPARTFELFAGELARWWPLAQFHTGPDPIDCAIEPHVGGRVFERAADGRETMWGMVLAYDPPARLAFSWIVGLSADTAQQVDVRFIPENGGTRVELTHSGWEKLGDEAANLRERYAQGWGTLVERFFAEYANSNT
ncbi:MAG TPA: SRPBCC family protein [Stellaceae bacterium]|jgi:uncharacterized protein YndB with AHSA1/START domain|nr:SRPBCC family protein [Stellaceae bacterium]